MTGATLQLQTKGIQDTFLTIEPQIHFFKYNYYKYVNFATDTLDIPLTTSAQFDTKISVTIPKKGHLLSIMRSPIRSCRWRRCRQRGERWNGL